MFAIFTGYQNRDKKVDKHNLIGTDYRLFQDTPAWGLAKADKMKTKKDKRNSIK